ncbi:MAG: hypothetical protein NT018_04385 [Armatimonadetes bacterium]|nr:hypothetical protein [Armatimonadota bacterium]
MKRLYMYLLVFCLGLIVSAAFGDPNLIFSASTDSLPATNGVLTGNWNTTYPVGGVLYTIGTPTVQIISCTKWEKNVFVDNEGYQFGSAYTAPIACNGASAIVVVKMADVRAASTAWTSVVDVFYDRLVLGVRNDTGQVNVRRNGSLETANLSTALPTGQIAVLSLVVQPTGEYKVYANGTEIMNITTTSGMTSLVNGVAGIFANYINLGRNYPDAWTTFNGNIGDVYLYKIAISDADRIALENSLMIKFGVIPPKPVADIAALKLNVGVRVKLTGTVTVTSKSSGLFFVGEKWVKGCIKVVGNDIVTTGSYLKDLIGVVSQDPVYSDQYTLTLTCPVIVVPTGNVINPVGVSISFALNYSMLRTKLVKVWGTVGPGVDYTIRNSIFGPALTVKAGGAAVPSGFVTRKGVLWREGGKVVLYQNP